MTTLVLHANPDDFGSIAAACTVTNRWKSFTACQWADDDTVDTDDPGRLFAILQEAGPVLPNLQELVIPFGTDYRDQWMTTGPNGVHICMACDASPNDVLRLPKCTLVDGPLVYLPDIGLSLPNLVHLSVNIPDNMGERPGFGTYFHHLPSQQLQSLRIVGQSDLSTSKSLDAAFISRGPVLALPALTSLIIVFPHLDAVCVTTLSKKLDCPNLKCAILSDLFVRPPIPADLLPDHSMESLEIHSFLEEVREMIGVLDQRCKHIKRLSFYIDQRYITNTSS